MDDDRRARAEAIEGFAATLQELRDSVGNPSFREMSGRSGAISHTTLHEATKGNRLPSWETTVEFVKACGEDPAAYRERWEKANRAVRPASAVTPTAGADVPASRPPEELAASATGTLERRTVHIAARPEEPEPVGENPVSAATPPPGGNPGHLQVVLPAQRGRRRFRPTRPAAALAAAAVGTGAVVLIVAVVNRGSGSEGQNPDPSGNPAVTALSPADCPVTPTNPPSAPPANKGDASVFIEDVTLPDCTQVGPGKTVTKVWRIQNVGTVPWKGYVLRRLDPSQRADQCQTISEVPIKDTPPGGIVDIRTEITTPRKPGFCYVRFKMADASGRLLFPGSRPVNFQIIVAER